ncbi:MAG: IS110 family transposase [Chloroflexi bacterium]|nr:IS110 family transposase [Chloroflexota bacterium]
MSREAEQLVGEDEEQIVERVAAIDVAKGSGQVCTRLPHASIVGRRVTSVWNVTATTNAIAALAGQLAARRIERVVVESTSDYWRPFVYLLQAQGLTVWLVNAREVKQVPGRPKTDKLDSVWLAKLNERGMLRPSFIPPVEIRRLRDYTRLRSDLVGERTRYAQRLEKLLEDALIKLSTVASNILGVSGRAMLEVLIVGERDPQVLAELARGRMRTKHAALVEALSGRFDGHHAELARLLLDQIDALNAKIDGLTGRIEQLIAAIPAAQAPTHPGGGNGGVDPASRPLAVVARLDEITGVGAYAAQVIVAEVGLDMHQFPSPGHLVSWAKLSPRTIQSGARRRAGKTGKGNRYLKSVLSEAAVAAARTDSFLGERYRRLVKRRGKLKALVAVARSILVIVWHLLADPAARYHDLGADFYTSRIHKTRRQRQLVRQLEALGYTVTLETAAIAA